MDRRQTYAVVANVEQQDIHPSNLTMIDGAVFEGAYEGLLRRGTAAEWMRRWAHHHHAQVAIRAARDGEEGARFRTADGTVWHLRRVLDSQGRDVTAAACDAANAAR